MDYNRFQPENIRSIPEMLEEAVKKYPKSPALIYFGKKISYKALLKSVNKIANFISLNVRQGGRVAIFMPNIPQFVLCYYGILRTWQRKAVPINFISLANELRSKPSSEIKVSTEIEAQLKDSRPALIFVADFLYPILSQVKMDWPHKIVVTSPGDFLSFPLKWLYPYKARREGKFTGPFPENVLQLSYVLKGTDEYRAIYPDNEDVAQFQYTGGTSGMPKAAMLTHKNLVSNILQTREVLGDILRDGKEVTLGALPLFHIYGLTTIVNITLLSLGGTVVLMPVFNPKDAVKLIQKYGVTVFPGVNRMYQALVSSLNIKKANLASLKLCVSGAGPIDKKVLQRFRELTGIEIAEGYGLSETSPIVSITLPADRINSDSSLGNFIGRPVVGTEIKITDDRGREVMNEQPGKINIRGPQVMSGYYGNPGMTADVMKDGWFRTGDTGCLDANGGLYFIDRDFIKRRGENIYPSIIEGHLLKHPLVAETAVIALTDQKDGEVPVACVVRASDPERTDEALATLIINYMKANATPLEIPSRIFFFASLDEFKNPIGKILKRKLKEEVLKKIELAV